MGKIKNKETEDLMRRMYSALKAADAIILPKTHIEEMAISVISSAINNYEEFIKGE